MKKFLCSIVVLASLLVSSFSYAQTYGVGLVPQGTDAPTTCKSGTFFWDTDDDILYQCEPDDSWNATGAGGEEEEIHASEHNEGGDDVIDRWTEGTTTLGTTDEDATPDITNGTETTIVRHWESANTAPTVVTNFTDGNDHSGFTKNDWFIYTLKDSNTTIDFSTGTYIIGNNATNFTGSDTLPFDLIFRYNGSKWQCTNLYAGMSNPHTLAAKVGMNYNTFTGTDTMTSTEAYHYHHYVTNTATITYPDATNNMQFCIEVQAAVVVTLDPLTTGTADTIRLNGVAAAQDENIVSDGTAGALICCGYYAADTWACQGDSYWAEATP